jgi:hypothetical protein
MPDARPAGRLIVNADDWGRDGHTTQCILDCFLRRGVSATSAMVFMADSERAAGLALEHGIDTGLHLNFTSPFTGACPPELSHRQRRVARYLTRHRFAQLVFNPTLADSFAYVAAAQIDEYRRLYGADPDRIDGHHHMHLCANVLLGRLLPTGTLVRRNFSFNAHEKGIVNRSYRATLDRLLIRRHRVVDFLFALPPLAHDRLQRIVLCARHHVVELETHPVQPAEYRFLTTDGVFRMNEGAAMSSFRGVRA